MERKPHDVLQRIEKKNVFFAKIATVRFIGSILGPV